jgi:Domain of unknown function (DUF4150)
MPGLFASTMAGGECMAMPDTCLTPAGPVMVPVPYPNIGMLPTAVDTTTTVLVSNMPAVVQGTMLPMSQGDDAGVGGGVASGMMMGPVRFTLASSKVRFQGQGVVFVTATTMQNMTNAVGAQVAPSQAKVLVGM